MVILEHLSVLAEIFNVNGFAFVVFLGGGGGGWDGGGGGGGGCRFLLRTSNFRDLILSSLNPFYTGNP